MTKQCKTCKYKDKIFCKRYPPKVISINHPMHTTQVYPEIIDNDWCGEYKKVYEYRKNSFS